MKNSLLALAALAALVSAPSQAAVEAFRVDKTLVTAESQEELMKTWVAQGQKRDEKMEEQARQVTLRNAALANEARRLKLNRDEAVRRDIDRATDEVMIRHLLQNEVNKTVISDEEINAQLETQRRAWGPTEVQVRHILVRDEKTAEQLLARVKKGEDMAALARANSLDSEQNKQAGGLIDWTSPRMFDQEFAAGFNSLQPGQLNPAVVHTKLGWHVIRLEGRRDEQTWSDPAAAAPKIRQFLLNKKLNEYVDGVVQKAKVSPADSQ